MLSTENAGGLVGIHNTTTTNVTVRMLIGTRVESLGRDVRTGEVVTISQKDASFLVPYGYATKDLEVESEAPAIEDVVTDEETTDETDGTDETDETDETEEATTDETTSASTGKRTGKRN